MDREHGNTPVLRNTMIDAYMSQSRLKLRCVCAYSCVVTYHRYLLLKDRSSIQPLLSTIFLYT